MKLETERLILREWTLNDVQDLIEGLNDLSVSKWLVFVPHPYTEQDAAKFINMCIDHANSENERTTYEFAIELKKEGKVIGGVSLDKISRVQGTAGGGIWISKKYFGNGYGTEAFGERIRFAFCTLGLRRLENGYIRGNPSSKKMQEKFGYKMEGLRRKAFRCMADGQIKDEYIMGLLAEEWIK